MLNKFRSTGHSGARPKRDGLGCRKRPGLSICPNHSLDHPITPSVQPQPPAAWAVAEAGGRAVAEAGERAEAEALPQPRPGSSLSHSQASTAFSALWG